MTYKQYIDDFIKMYYPFNDYLEMKLACPTNTDGLCKDRQITHKQFQNWATPCTPETFKNFNHKFW